MMHIWGTINFRDVLKCSKYMNNLSIQIYQGFIEERRVFFWPCQMARIKKLTRPEATSIVNTGNQPTMGDA